MRIFNKTFIALCLCALAGTFVAPSAEAQQRPRPQQIAQANPTKGGGGKATSNAKVKAGVMVVHATEDGSYVDPKLKNLERHLQHLKYSSYRVMTQENLELSKDASKKVDAEGGWDVNLTLLSTNGDKARIRVRVSSKKGNIADITIAVANGRTFVVSGPKYDGGILLIPITAKF